MAPHFWGRDDSWGPLTLCKLPGRLCPAERDPEFPNLAKKLYILSK